MEIHKAPLRISFFGGGTDNPEFVKHYGPGMVLGTAINVYVERKMDKGKITTSHPVPLRTGLGSSSAGEVVKLSSSGRIWNGLTDLAMQAWQNERDNGSSTGWQDAAFAAFGGTYMFEFHEETFIRYLVPNRRLEELEQHLLLLNTGRQRTGDYAKRTIDRMMSHRQSLMLARKTAEEGMRVLTGAVSMASFGSMVDASWKIKRSLGLSLPEIDILYERGLAAGAFGGKLCGAGGGGYLLFVVPPEFREEVIRQTGLEELKFKINARGWHSEVTEHSASPCVQQGLTSSRPG